MHKNVTTTEREAWEFIEKLRYYVAQLEDRGISRAEICEAAEPKLSRNVITNMLAESGIKPEYGTVARLVGALRKFGINWNVDEALEQAGFGDTRATGAPRQVYDEPPMAIATMRLPVYDARLAAQYGATPSTITDFVEFHARQIAFRGLIEGEPDTLALLDTLGAIEPEDYVVARVDHRFIVATMYQATADNATIMGRLVGYVDAPGLLSSLAGVSASA